MSDERDPAARDERDPAARDERDPAAHHAPAIAGPNEFVDAAGAMTSAAEPAQATAPWADGPAEPVGEQPTHDSAAAEEASPEVDAQAVPVPAPTAETAAESTPSEASRPATRRRSRKAAAPVSDSDAHYAGGPAALPDGAAQPEPSFTLPLVAPQPDPEPRDDPLPGRPVALRLARTHLRTGALAIARAQLESLAGRGALDEDALIDLAEVRWRTGDLAGAGEAANAAISRGRREGLILVIAAEAVAAVGRPSEARRLAARALGTIEGPLDPIFAGMPRAAIWPGDDLLDGPAADVAGSRARAVAGGAAVGASAAAAEAFAGGRAAIARGDTTTAAVRLGLALRLDPGFARGVLDIVEDRTEAPLIAIVAGDALRLLGREDEALEAYTQARLGVTAGPSRRGAQD